MTRTRFVFASAALTAAMAFGPNDARAQNGGVAERVGEALDNTGRAIKGGVQGAIVRSKARVGTMEVLDRVTSRLHWEKGLATSALEVEVQPGGVTVLRGVTPDAKAKAKAVELARNTTGVVQVVDQISITPVTGTNSLAPVVQPAAPVVVPPVRP